MILTKAEKVRTKRAYDAAAEICKYKQMKHQAEKDMKTAVARNDLRWYMMRKSAAEACDRLIAEAMRLIKGAKPTFNKASTPNLKYKDGGSIMRTK
jgi:hypothetical protein